MDDRDEPLGPTAPDPIGERQVLLNLIVVQVAGELVIDLLPGCNLQLKVGQLLQLVLVHVRTR